jgi:hypothetical protein
MITGDWFWREENWENGGGSEDGRSLTWEDGRVEKLVKGGDFLFVDGMSTECLKRRIRRVKDQDNVTCQRVRNSRGGRCRLFCLRKSDTTYTHSAEDIAMRQIRLQMIACKVFLFVSWLEVRVS